MEDQQKGENLESWSEAVEDLVAAGDTDGAISLLETRVSDLQSQSCSNPSLLLQLASALGDLATLYSSKGFSLKADDFRSRASVLKHQAFSGDIEVRKEQKEDQASASDVALRGNDSVNQNSSSDGHLEQLTKSPYDKEPDNGSSDDDWEAIADREPDELLSSQCLPGVSELSLTDTKVQAPKRRGRGTFSYKKHELYSDQLSDKGNIDNSEDDGVCRDSEKDVDRRYSSCGTRHILLLADFPPSTRTTDLEKLFQDFKDHGFVIRWVNDTNALAVFRTPSIALEAYNSIECPFTVRILDVDDTLMSSISSKDLEPPRPRPKTSASTAQRLIAQGMGLKLPSTASGSQEFRNLEDARKNRIVTRQKLRNDAWGDD